MEFDTSLGNKIRARRRALGLTQRDLADQIGIGFQHVQRHESGVTPIPAGRLARFAAALRLTPAELLDDVTDPPTDDALAFQAAHLFRKLPETQKRAILALMQSILSETPD